MKRLSLFYRAGSFVKRIFDKIARTIYHPKPTIKELAWGNYSDAGGDLLRYHSICVNSDSIVFDLGGYDGQWASDIYSAFRSKIFIFEIYNPYYQQIKNRFSNNDDIKVFNFGLAPKTTTTKISIDGVGTSEFKVSDNMIEVELKKAADFISENNIQKIDLMKINIEGAEYELLDHLISSGTIKIINNLQIQFHDFIPDALAEMNSIREKLGVTHFSTFKFDFIWDNWKLKE